MKNPVALLYSPRTCRADAARSARYACHDDGEWLQGLHAGLEVAGLTALLRRFSWKHDLVSAEDTAALAGYRVYIVADAAELEVEARLFLQREVIDRPGRWLILTGRHPLAGEWGEVPAPQRAAGVLTLDGLPLLAAGFFHCRVETEGGRRRVKLDDGTPFDLAVRRGNVLWLPHQGCAFLGALAQMHLCGWEYSRDPFFADSLAGLLHETMRGVLQEALPLRLSVLGPEPALFLLRHDTDGSRDTTFADLEEAEGLPATFAVLAEENTRFWCERLRSSPCLSAAFHYTSYDLDADQRVHPGRHHLSAAGLQRQFRRAAELGIPTVLGLKQYNFFFYPETVAAFDHLQRAVPRLKGLGSLSTMTCVHYGRVRECPWPLTASTFWFPHRYRLQQADIQREIPLWEMPHLMEPAPALIDACLRHVRRLPGAVLGFGFHPAHTRSGIVENGVEIVPPGGNLPAFRHLLAEARAAGIPFVAKEALYDRLNHWQAVALEIDTAAGRLRLDNPLAEAVDLYLHADPALALADPGLRLLAPGLYAVHLPPAARMEISWT